MAKVMKLMIDGIAYTAAMPENTVTDVLSFQGPIELQLKRYADQEYYAPLTHPLPVFNIPMTSNARSGGLYCYQGFGVLSILFNDAPLHPYEAVHLGDINEDIRSHLAMAGNTVSARIEIVFA
ncbi:MAG: cyclophilin-like fold protein [Trichococcus sp.]|uniref:cyclophilin-like fold protein n=1 Tax=Trichococcus sp. TaxID=1985464 RepID=UPI003C51437D